MDFDIIIIGAGISGAGAAYALAGERRILMLEGESQPGYHSTGRSAAVYEPNLGNATVRAFCIASGAFLRSPPPGFAEAPLMTPRGELTVSDAEHRPVLDALLALDGLGGNPVKEIDVAAAAAMIPVLRLETVRFAAYEPGVMDMDVHAIHRGYLKAFAARGGSLRCDAPVSRIERRAGLWHVEAGGESFAAGAVINAAGAWADRVAVLAGLAPVGLQPKRRTAVILPPPEGMDVRSWPVLGVAGDEAYINSQSGKLLASPGDATPVEPQDVQPEELDIAILVDWIERRTTLQVRRIERRWAGLRTFAPDNSPVMGEDPSAPGFWWLAGQGGYGIMMSESLGRSLAALMTRGELPADVRALGVAPEAIGPGRFLRSK
jgi:D-arginine dehydrogenase